MPRSPIWPVEPGAPASRRDAVRRSAGAAAARRRAAVESPHRGGARGRRPIEEPRRPAAGRPGPLGCARRGARRDAADPAAELLARSPAASKAAVRPGRAGLALALRADPALAPAVLDLLAGRAEPVLALVRGDAHRIVGHEAEATRDYAAAAGGRRSA